MRRSPLLPVKLAVHELRHGARHFAVFVACLILGVAVMAAVGTLGNIVRGAINNEAQSLLGGDVEVSLSGSPAPPEAVALMKTYGALSYVSTLRAMMQHNGYPVLVELKAVDDAYPLMGTLELKNSVQRQQAISGNGLIVDESLLTQLNMTIGDSVSLGNAKYIINAVLKREPDRVVHLFSFGPRVMLSHASLAASGLVSPLSLIEHDYRIVFSKGKSLAKLQEALEAHFPDLQWRLKTGTDSNATIKRFLSQLLAFLTLSGLATFLIGGIGIGSSVRAYLEKKYHCIATLKILGASRRDVFIIYALVIGILSLIGGIIGILIAAIAVSMLMPLIAEWLPLVENAHGFSGAASFLAVWYGILIAYLFSTPALLSALNVRASTLFRSRSAVLQLTTGKHTIAATFMLAAALLHALLVNAFDPLFTGGGVAVALFAFLLFWICSRVVKFIARRIRAERPWVRLMLANFYRPGSTTGTVIFAIGISLTVLIALTLTEANFQSRLTRIIEEKAPSLFIIDIQPHQKEAFAEFLKKEAPHSTPSIFPMVRGRIVELNGKPVVPEDVDEDVRWAVRGDRGLSYSATPPENAQLSQGQWWPADYNGKPLMSVDDRFLEGMKLKLGDTITLNILGEDMTATIANARKIDYTTLQINFSMMLSPGAISEYPHTYICTIHLPGEQEAETALVRKIAAAFPEITIVRTAEAVSLIREVMQHIATALRITVGISLLVGLLVLTSALSSTIEQRLYDTAILKVLGARQRDILTICLSEWLLLAFITSILAAGLGTLSSWLVMQRFRGEGFFLMPEITGLTILCCAVVIGVTGYIGNRQVFRLKPSSMLRNE